MPRMKAYAKQDYTARLFSYARVPVPGLTGVFALQHNFLRNVRLSVSISPTGNVSGIFTTGHSDILPQWQLRDLRDPTGREMYPNGIWIIDNYEPIINLYDEVDSYRAVIRLNHTEADDEDVIE